VLPRIFVSSTVEDLHHLRDGVREAILELEYTPIMSEYGEIGYLPDRSAEESCYSEMNQSDVAVLILGKRYGQTASGGLSVTHNEFRTARDRRLPVFTLVDREVLSYKKVHDANVSLGTAFPGVDEPTRLFSFLEEIRQYPSNNGFIPYATVAEARTQLKRQLGHYVGDIIRSSSGKALDLRDVLAEIKTLRHETTDKVGNDEVKLFLTVMKRLLGREGRVTRTFAEVLEQVFEDVEASTTAVLESSSLKELFSRAGYEVVVMNAVDPFDPSSHRKYAGGFLDPYTDSTTTADVGNFVVTNTQVLLDPTANRVFTRSLQDLRVPLSAGGPKP